MLVKPLINSKGGTSGPFFTAVLALQARMELA